jgi:xanthine dehydrogenase accessory factor
MREARVGPSESGSVDIHRTIAELSSAGRAFAVAVILNAEGSTPRKTGVKAIIDPDGRISGTIGGGAVEAATQARAVEAIKSGVPILVDFDLEGLGVADEDAICGGTLRVLIDPTATKDRAAYVEAAEGRERREPGVLLTTVRGTSPATVKVNWLARDAISSEAGFPPGEAMRACLAQETPRCFVEDLERGEARVEVLVEPIVPQPRLLIVGGGHIGQALALQASLLGFDITIIDDRPDFTNRALFPQGTTTRCGDIGKEVGRFPIDPSAFVVVVTRGHQHDATALAACIHQPAAYLGMIGSRRKVALLRKDFLESGRATTEEWDRVCAPIGLDIGAVTVPEIATSIAAQLVAVRRKRGRSTMPGDFAVR